MSLCRANIFGEDQTLQGDLQGDLVQE